MTTALILLDRRSAPALGIHLLHDVVPVDDHPGFFHVTDTAPGRGGAQ